MTLAEDVLKRHTPRPHGESCKCPGGKWLDCELDNHGCDAGCGVWPCPPYRLAVMVREVEALAETPLYAVVVNDTEESQVVLAADILAITKGDKT